MFVGSEQRSNASSDVSNEYSASSATRGASAQAKSRDNKPVTFTGAQAASNSDKDGDSLARSSRNTSG